MFDIAEAWRSDRITLKTARDVLSAILQEFIPNIKLADDGRKEPLRIQKYEYEIHFPKEEYYEPLAFLDSEQIIQLLRQCVSLDLGPQVRQLFDKLERLARDEVEPAIIFVCFFLPLSKELNEMSADQNPGSLAQEVHNLACLFTKKLPSLYASRCVGPKPPPRPIGWRRPKHGCGCEECLQLDSFLDDPALEITNIQAISEDRLRHLVDQLPTWPEHRTRIEPTPSGFELQIKKWNKEGWASLVEDWVYDRDSAKKIFGFFNDNKDMMEDLEKALKNLGREQKYHGNQASGLEDRDVTRLLWQASGLAYMNVTGLLDQAGLLGQAELIWQASGLGDMDVTGLLDQTGLLGQAE